MWFGCGGRLLGIWVGTWGRNFAVVLPSVVLVSRIQLAQRYRVNIATSFSSASSSRRETMVGDALERASSFRVGLGVSGDIIAPGLRACPSRSCGGWVCGLGAVGASLVFGLVRGAGTSLWCFRLLF